MFRKHATHDLWPFAPLIKVCIDYFLNGHRHLTSRRCTEQPVTELKSITAFCIKMWGGAQSCCSCKKRQKKCRRNKSKRILNGALYCSQLSPVSHWSKITHSHYSFMSLPLAVCVLVVFFWHLNPSHVSTHICKFHGKILENPKQAISVGWRDMLEKW